MIVETPDIDISDAESTNTLVTGQKIPQYLPTLVYASLVISTTAFIFAIIDNVDNRWSSVPQGLIVTILAYISTLPHHSAVLLLKWLERHQTESILPFAPSSPRSVAYSFISFALWVGSTAVCAKNLYMNTRSQSYSNCIKDDTSPTGYTCYPYIWHPGIEVYGNSLASSITSLLESLLAISITAICYMHHRRLNKKVQTAPSPTSTPTESKVLSA